MESQKTRIYQHMQPDREYQPAELAEALDIPEKHVKGCLLSLMRGGLCTRRDTPSPKGGHYRLWVYKTKQLQLPMGAS